MHVVFIHLILICIWFCQGASRGLLRQQWKTAAVAARDH